MSRLKEWAPLTDLFIRLPSKMPTGIFFRDVKLTCVDATSEFLALGTNHGIVYWYNRNTKEIQKLKCETQTTSTVVKIVSTVDYMVACGNADGLISIFQIPKEYPDSIPESLKPKNKNVERYTVSELHKASISALEWSKNGMKLFSGDKNGMVVLTELDFYMHLCKSAEILNESYEVVQLSYHQQNLLISTTYRTIICQQLDKWKISQVGKKDRKTLGTFGAIFCKSMSKPSDTILYCTRPGLRIWVSDIQGSVKQTLVFKDLLNAECPEVALINPASESLRNLKPHKEASFGVLLAFEDDLLVTYNNDILYVLNPKEFNVVATVCNLRRVLSVATTKDEIFVLEGDRSLIRLSSKPESNSELTDPTTTPNGTFIHLPPTLRDLTLNLHVADIISAIPPLVDSPRSGGLDVYTDTSTVINAEEATESPQNSSAAGDSCDSMRKFEAYSKIGELQYEDAILYKHQRRRKKGRAAKAMSSSVTSLSSSGSEEKDGGLGAMNLSAIGVLPDLRSPDSIQNDIEYKEKILADVLNFEKIKDGLNGDGEVNGRLKGGFDGLKEEKRGDEKGICVKPIVFPKLSSSRIFDERELQEKESDDVHVLKDAPACLNIPNSWKLTNIELQNEKIESSLSDAASLADWEII